MATGPPHQLGFAQKALAAVASEACLQSLWQLDFTCAPYSHNPQEHVEEYGAHWNFFCTIAVVLLLAHLLPNPPPWLSLVVACAHQAVLSAGESSESDSCYCFAAA